MAVADAHLRAAQEGGRSRVDGTGGDDVPPRDEFSASLQTVTSSSADAAAGIASTAVATSDGMIARAHSPNQRARLVAPNSCFSAAYSRDGSFRCAAAAGPPRKLTATLLTSPSPNSA